MADLAPNRRDYPLAGVTPLAHPALAMTPLAVAIRLSLRIAAGDHQRGGRSAGLDLDCAINTWIDGDGGTRALRLGPDEWLVLAEDGSAVTLAGDLSRALAERFHAVVDVSHRFAAIEIAGLAAADVLNAGCPLDLDARRFPTGTATRTLLAKAEIVLQRTDDRPGFRIEVARSHAAYAWAFLAEASREVVED